MQPFEFGNDPAKVARYRAFWNRDAVKRPLVGFTCIGWFPFSEFESLRALPEDERLTPEQVVPSDFLRDHVRMLREGETMDDDMIRGACPGQVAIPWLPAALGRPLRILPENLLAEEVTLPWQNALKVRLDPDNPWFRLYLEFAEALVKEANGRFPVSHSAELGPTDLHALLRGHTQSLLDLVDSPGESAEMLRRGGEFLCQFTEALWRRVPLFEGGYFDAQYSLWAPGPIIRMQEDATAVYSPKLYRQFVQPVDRMLARHFASSFIHLHSTSMFLLDAILEIDEIRCYEINNDALGPPVAELIQYLQRVQKHGKPLLVRGSFHPAELQLVMDSLDPRGLFLNIMVKNIAETEPLRAIAGM
ncbi:MAG: hypothetical protein IT364_06215 [Candidatus Hydrogenedentes bacterium]|nr:hypothetical protein [Candidatus Hydrogenedentota bacterium]